MKNATMHQLRVFEVVARHCSYTRAAEELFLTQPTVSMQMKQLTQAVGLPLFEQIGKRLYLTDAGQKLYTTCKDIFDRLSQFEMDIADMKGMKQGQLKLSTVTTTKYFLPRILGPFCDRYPGIDVSLKFTNHEGIQQYLHENSSDLYILSQVPENLDVVSYKVIENPLVVLAPYNHPLTKERQIPIARIAEEPFIMRESGSGTRQVVQKLFDRHDLKLKVRLELSSNEAIKQAIVGGLGLSILSRHTLALEGMTKPLAVLDVAGFPIQNYWYVIYPSGKQLSVVGRTFLNYLQQEGEQITEASAFFN
ncbi:LysR family transcriptional regulator [Merismopedia glauca CCAP 1448/3]|uniref:LysR family transcriptional regulator n=1 Tax=Merismopedia glauca CCAP 1448/3 TaxID=1296344 RepID=A0A2T1C380_9CYAN|nr:LysR family transcriptional regulator [Merismopedia glauca]PSB02726.1 LysR family transcriptional regulator [Merismopedia glauca CCAP 1448/3]